MNSISNQQVFMRSMATRSHHTSVSPAVRDASLVLSASGADLVILETAGIGQSGSEVVDLSDLSLYVMTPEFGAPSQLEKIDMLDFADVVALNKADKRGAEDATRYVAKQMQRNRQAFDQSPDEMPVFACMASRFGDVGVDRLFTHLCSVLNQRMTEKIGDLTKSWSVDQEISRAPNMPTVVPPHRVRYLSEISETIRAYHRRTKHEAQLASEADGVRRTLTLLGHTQIPLAALYSPQPAQINPTSSSTATPSTATPSTSSLEGGEGVEPLIQLYNQKIEALHPLSRSLLQDLPALRQGYTAEEHSYTVRGREIKVKNYTTSLSRNPIPKVSLPQTQDWSTLLQWRLKENIPGQFPFTAGVFPYKRSGEDPTRMFAGEGHPERTNRRFHYLSIGQPAARLSTAFDSVTLYGRDPDLRPDIYGKVGNSGVSVAIERIKTC